MVGLPVALISSLLNFARPDCSAATFVSFSLGKWIFELSEEEAGRSDPLPIGLRYTQRPLPAAIRWRSDLSDLHEPGICGAPLCGAPLFLGLGMRRLQQDCAA